MEKNTDLLFGDWEGGHHAGTLRKDGNIYTVHATAAQILLSRVNVLHFGGDDTKARQAACDAAAKESITRGLTKNRYRVVRNTLSGTAWYEMQLNRGKTMLFDMADLDFARGHTWHAHDHTVKRKTTGKKNIRFYAMARGCDAPIYFHSSLTGWSYVHHVNQDTLDNRRANLEESDPAHNAGRKRISVNNTSGITGVSLNKKYGIWFAGCGGKRAQHKSFSIRKLGNDEAFRQAVAYRRAIELERGWETVVTPKRPRGPSDEETTVPTKRRRLE